VDLSFNALTSLDGIGVARQLRELSVANNKIGSYRTSTRRPSEPASKSTEEEEAAARRGEEEDAKKDKSTRRPGEPGGGDRGVNALGGTGGDILSKGGIERLERLTSADISGNKLVTGDIQVFFSSVCRYFGK
jgi:hypothetical protein